VLAEPLAIAGDVVRGGGGWTAAEEHADLVVASGELCDDVTADEPRAADDEHAHARRLAHQAAARGGKVRQASSLTGVALSAALPSLT